MKKNNSNNPLILLKFAVSHRLDRVLVFFKMFERILIMLFFLFRLVEASRFVPLVGSVSFPKPFFRKRDTCKKKDEAGRFDQAETSCFDHARAGVGKYCLITSILILLFFLFPYKLLAQQQSPAIDSLKSLLQNTATDSEKVKILFLLSDKIPCTDSSNKLLYAREALQLAKKKNITRQIINANAKLGSIYSFCLRNQRLSIVYNEQYAESAKQCHDTINEATACAALGNSYKAIDNFTKAIEYYNLALSLNLNSDLRMMVWGNMGVVYKNVGDFPKALYCYTQSFKILEETIRAEKSPDIMDTLQMAQLLTCIGEIYVEMHEYNKALENYKKALQLGGQNANLAIMAFMGIGRTYDDCSNANQAVEYYKKALIISHQVHDRNETMILRLLADIYLKTSQLFVAMEYANNSLAEAEKNNDSLQLPTTYVTLAKIYTQQKQYNIAVSYLKKAIAIAENTQVLDNQEEAWQALSATYDAMNKKAEAFDAYRHYITLRDSLFNTGRANELTRIDLESGFARKQLADSIKQVKQSTAYEVRIQRQRLLAWSGYGGVALLLLLAFFIYRNYSQQKSANVTISLANETIKAEKQVSENLLLNILPEEVAKELKTNGSVQAKMFDNVTVLFTDFVNFTAAGEQFSPQELVAELHNCFKKFDEIISKYHIEKIKTVGDAYLAVSGLPYPYPAHATDIVKAALEIRDFMVQRRKDLGNQTFEIRIGINSGTVVAGIVGVKKFAYDIWGDTVNTAARMEQYSDKGKVNISKNTYELVKNEFTFTPRMGIQVKNKGVMDMYFVND